MGIRRLCLLSALALALWACGADDSDSATDAGTAVETGMGDGLGDSDNTQCAGGEVCRDGVCRQFCGEDDPCTDEDSYCDLELGYSITPECYEVLQNHLESFLEQASADGRRLPAFVTAELRSFLRCGVHA